MIFSDLYAITVATGAIVVEPQTTFLDWVLVHWESGLRDGSVDGLDCLLLGPACVLLARVVGTHLARQCLTLFCYLRKKHIGPKIA